MKVTRDVIYDLLPGYFAGELSADAKALVDEFFETDPEFARMAGRFGKLFKERRPGGAGTPASEEKQVFERARSFRTKRDRQFATAVGFTFGALLALFVGALTPGMAPLPIMFGFLRPPAVIIATVFGAVAVASWIGWFVSGRQNARL